MISLFHAKPKAKPVKKRGGGKGGESLHLAIDGAPVAVKLRLNPRARRVIVKVDPGTGDVTVVAPSRTGLKHALDFARGEQDWIARQRARVPQRVTLAPGAKLPFRGQAHEVRHGGQRGPQTTILTPGNYRLNTYLWDVTIHNAVDIAEGFVGVVKSNVVGAAPSFT